MGNLLFMASNAQWKKAMNTTWPSVNSQELSPSSDVKPGSSNAPKPTCPSYNFTPLMSVAKHDPRCDGNFNAESTDVSISIMHTTGTNFRMHPGRPLFPLLSDALLHAKLAQLAPCLHY